MEDFSAASIAQQIIQQLKFSDLELANCVGPGYDGASTMSGRINGAQALIINLSTITNLHSLRQSLLELGFEP